MRECVIVRHVVGDEAAQSTVSSCGMTRTWKRGAGIKESNKESNLKMKVENADE
jgi:hypothetical protein